MALFGKGGPRWRAGARKSSAPAGRASASARFRSRPSQDVTLDGTPRVRVRRAIVNGRLGPPKTKHSRRDVPLPADLAQELRERRLRAEWCADGDLIFPNRNGESLNVRNLRRRHFKPAAKKAGAPWVRGFHVLRHTAASMLFERGANAVQVQRWLGHHSPAFTLDTYVQLNDDLGDPLDLPGVFPGAWQADGSGF
jgi:integrase